MPAETTDQKIARLKAARLEVEAKRPKLHEPGRYYPLYGMEDEIRFGKHVGKTVADVLESDPNWLRWALENVATFGISGEG